MTKEEMLEQFRSVNLDEGTLLIIGNVWDAAFIAGWEERQADVVAIIEGQR